MRIRGSENINNAKSVPTIYVKFQTFAIAKKYIEFMSSLKNCTQSGYMEYLASKEMTNNDVINTPMKELINPENNLMKKRLRKLADETGIGKYNYSYDEDIFEIYKDVDSLIQVPETEPVINVKFKKDPKVKKYIQTMANLSNVSQSTYMEVLAAEDMIKKDYLNKTIGDLFDL